MNHKYKVLYLLPWNIYTNNILTFPVTNSLRVHTGISCTLKLFAFILHINYVYKHVMWNNPFNLMCKNKVTSYKQNRLSQPFMKTCFDRKINTVSNFSFKSPVLKDTFGNLTSHNFLDAIQWNFFNSNIDDLKTYDSLNKFHSHSKILTTSIRNHHL